MKINNLGKKSSGLTLALICGGILLPSVSADAQAAIDMQKRPSLIITNKPAADIPRSNALYTSPVRVPDISANQISQDAYYQPTQTVVSQKVQSLRADLTGLQSRVSSLSTKLKSLQDRNRSMSAEYNASIATINTQLQSGTTPGNPRLVEKLSVAQRNLDQMSESVADLNGMAVDAANAASMGSFLLDACRSAYGLSGAVEEDHADLAQVEDQINNTIVTIDRLLNELNDDITRNAAYLSAEHGNIRTLSLAVTNGDYYGRSLAARPFSNAPASTIGAAPTAVAAPSSPTAITSEPLSGTYTGGTQSSYQNSYMDGGYSSGNAYTSPQQASRSVSNPRPLVKIKFDQPNVDYEQAVYMAMNEAMQKYPSARFELIAVTPTNGNAAQVAIESTHARRNAESVLRTLSQMGMDVGKIDLTTQQSAEAKTNEVQIYIR